LKQEYAELLEKKNEKLKNNNLPNETYTYNESLTTNQHQQKQLKYSNNNVF